MRVLALDFDGVLADSLSEAFVVALRTHAALVPDSPFAPGEQDASLRARFEEIVPLGNRAEDYCVALEALRRGVALEDQAGYDAFKARLDPSLLRAFHRRFYRVRAEWSRRDPEGWLARMQPYPGIRELLRRRAGETALAIATAKDRRSVGELLRAWGIADLFGDRVLDKETGVRKRAHIEHLMAATGAPAPDITFVDDKVNHLEDVAALGTRCALAAWGYNGPREQRAAERAGFLVLQLDDAEQKLFGPDPSPTRPAPDAPVS